MRYRSISNQYRNESHYLPLPKPENIKAMKVQPKVSPKPPLEEDPYARELLLLKFLTPVSQNFRSCTTYRIEHQSKRTLMGFFLLFGPRLPLYIMLYYIFS